MTIPVKGMDVDMGWTGRYQRQRQCAAAADQDLQARESANGDEQGPKKCGRDMVGGGAEAGKERMRMDVESGAGQARRSGREGSLKHCGGAGGFGRGPRGCGRESTRGQRDENVRRRQT